MRRTLMPTDQPVAGPTRTWRFNKPTYGCHDYQLGYYSPLHWEFSDGCRGSGGRTPWVVVRSAPQ